MKTDVEYLIESCKKHGVMPSNKDYVALYALNECLNDHELFVEEMLERTNKLITQIKELQEIIQRLSSGL